MSKPKLWASYILTTLAVLFLIMDGVMKVIRAEVAVQTTLELGYPEYLVPVLGGLLLVCVLIHVISQTSVLGAILLTGYLGGAIATQVRVGNPLFSHILFGVYLGLMLWGGLYLRNPTLGSLLPITRSSVG